MQFRRPRTLSTRLDATPMADTVFLLLIFFMLSTSFVVQPGIQVKLPKAVTSEIQLKKDLILTITAENILFLNEEPVTLDKLGEALEAAFAQRKDRILIIKADQEVRHGMVVQAMDIAKLSGADRLAIATEPKLP
ncbi:biopolymer transporter ExbD [bacterium]|jgi:biopolymer transport protein ExbD|nr:biopolymer transporter ExbD [bacterium]